MLVPGEGRSSRSRLLARLPRGLSRLGRTRTERSVLLLVGVLAAFALGRWSTPAPADGGKGRVPASLHGLPIVIDGDTLELSGTRVRLFGIDAFERDQPCERTDTGRWPCGLMARQSLLAAVDGAPVTCTTRDVDRYGRAVASCSGRHGDVAAAVVLDGYALAYREYSTDYVDEEDVARRAARGAWAGAFAAPWDWRHRATKPKGR